MLGWKERWYPGFKSCLDLANYVILGRVLSFSELCLYQHKVETKHPGEIERDLKASPLILLLNETTISIFF